VFECDRIVGDAVELLGLAEQEGPERPSADSPAGRRRTASTSRVPKSSNPE
jgi:hypothetical protein